MNGEANSGSGIRLRLFGRTDVGQIREHNEDNFRVADLTRKSRSLMESDRLQNVAERGTVLGVCDGMGGAAAGEVAVGLGADRRADLRVLRSLRVLRALLSYPFFFSNSRMNSTSASMPSSGNAL